MEKKFRVKDNIWKVTPKNKLPTLKNNNNKTFHTQPLFSEYVLHIKKFDRPIDCFEIYLNFLLADSYYRYVFLHLSLVLVLFWKFHAIQNAASPT